MWHHPKYYKELRKRNKEEARAQLKVPSSNLDQTISKESSTEENQRASDPGLTETQASSGKRQAPSRKHQAPSRKRQAP
jgi:hypothetical protein